MIKLLNESKEHVALLTNVTNLKVVKDLNSVDQIELNFTASNDYRYELKCERYLRLKGFDNEYIIKEVNDNGYDIQVIAICNIEDLQGNAFKEFTSLEQNINNTILAALNGTGWTYELHCNTKKKRTLRKKITNSYDVLSDVKKVFRVEYKFDALNKKLYVYDTVGADKGSYFMSDLNLVSLNKEGHTYDIITRIYPIGKNDLTIESVNSGRNYVDNLAYKNKVIAAYWKDERYTTAESLRDDAIAKLADLSKPYISYKAVIKDLAAINGTDIHMYDIGDTVTIVDKKTRTRETQRIVKMTIYPQDPDNNTCEIASHALTFEDLQAEKDNILNLAGDTIGTDGTISTDDLNGSIEVDDNSITGEKIKADEISAQHIQANSIQTKHLTANSISSEKIQANSIQTKHLTAGSVTATNIAAGSIQAGSSIIANGAIGSAQISDLEANKLTTGTIDTSRVTVAGPNSNLKMSGNRLQVFTGIGSKQVERVSLGDVNGDGSKYGLLVRGADGKTVIMDENGVTNAGITNGSITNDKISGNANIDGAKLNINSVITRINGATESISGTKIDVNGTNLSAKLSQQDTTITEQGKKIAANSTSITANTNAIKLKVDSQTYTADKNNMNSTLNKHTSEISAMKDSIALKVEQSDINTAKKELQSSINTNKNNISAVKTDVTNIKNNVAAIEVNVSGITQRVSSTESTISTHTTQLGTVDNRINTAKNAAISTAASDATTKANNAQSKALADAKSYTNGQITTVNKTITDKVAEIKTTTDSITQRVSSAETKVNTVTANFNNLQIGGRNLWIEKNLINAYESNGNATSSTSQHKMMSTYTDLNGAKYVTVQLWNPNSINNNSNSNRIAFYDSNKAWISSINTPKPNGTNYVSGIITVPTNAKYMKIGMITGSSQHESSIKIKVELGNKATDWTPSPEDIDSSIANVQTQVTTTSNKVATIETNLSSITSRVSSTESTVNTINGNITSLQNRMSSAEQQITSSAIINTVQSTINAAKSEAINSANSSTDNKLKSYATTSSLTQTENSITAKFESSGGSNLVKNGAFKNGTAYWTKWGSPSAYQVQNSLNGYGQELRIVTTDKDQGAYQTIEGLRTGVVHTVVVDVWVSSGNCIIYIVDGGTWRLSSVSSGTGWKKLHITFTPSNPSVTLRIGRGTEGTNGDYRFTGIRMYEGSAIQSWTPHHSEVYNGSTVIDANGVTINNGALTIKNKAGTTVLSGDSNGNLNLYAVGSKFKFTATGQRVTEMYSDASGNGDVFTIKVPFYNKDSGFRLCTDTGVNLIEAYAENGDVHRLKLHGFQTDNIKATYMVASKQLYRYDDSGIYWKPIYTRNENAGIKMIDKLGIVNKSAGGLYMQVDMDGGGAYGIDIWSSDVNLKKNIKELNSKIKPLSLQEDNATGLELIKKIKHYEFDYDETKGFEGHIDCGYVSQQLQEVNTNLVTEVEQEDGTVLLQPLASALLPHITKAMQQQQEKIEELENIILELKSRIGA